MRRTLWLSALALGVLACNRGPSTPAPSVTRPGNVSANWRLFDSTVAVSEKRAMVVAGHPLASKAGVEILKAGGNAIDAAVAVGFAMAVVHPEAGNIGGGGFMMIRTVDGKVRAIDYREMAPGAATPNMYVDSAGNVTEKSLTGHLASGVPGSVAGLAEAQRTYGRLSLARVMAPAVKLARDGYEIDAARSRSIRSDRTRLGSFPASRSQFLVNDSAPAIGHRFKQADLARTLQAIADSGPRVFYEGYVADLIAAEMASGGGLITKADLASYRPVWREPIVIRYRGHTIYSMPPASSGGVTMAEILNILEGFNPLPPFGTPEQVHLVAEAMRRGFIDRNFYLGDPAFVEMPLQRLTSKDYAGSLRASIDRDRATPTPTLTPTASEHEQTTHYSVVDALGNAVSVTTTLNGGFGSAVTVTGAGFLLNNEMDDFTSAPGKPNQYGLIQGEANAIRPGKRMLSAMTPSIVLDTRDSLLMVVGTPGGPTIITSVAQVISNVIDHGMTLADAVAAPRIHHQSLPDRIFYERNGLVPPTVERLTAMGHALEERRGYSGDIAAIMRGPGGWIGVSDPRRGGGAKGY